MPEDNPFVYVVDDDRSIRESLSNLIHSVGLNVQTFASAQAFLTSPRPEAPSCLVLDVQFPGLSGLDLQRELAKDDVQIPIIFITGHGDIPMTVQAMKAGAIEFLTKPCRDDDLLNAIEQAISRSRQLKPFQNKPADETPGGEDALRRDIGFLEIVGHSAALRHVLQAVETVAPTDATVLLAGETGTGKELIARAIHMRSRRGANPFVTLNCAAIPTGLLESELFGHERGAFTGAIGRRLGRFELAHRGTLLLDEVGDLPLELQPKLLRVLQERAFERLGSTRTVYTDARLIAATNTDLAQMVAEKHFRSDLYYRLNVFPIVIPPLRERREDIPLLVRYFVQKYARRLNKRIETIPAQAMTALTAYHWPGNVRELEHFIERSVILSRELELQPPLAELPCHMPSSSAVASSANHAVTLRDAEREHILRTLEETQWVMGGSAGAAARLGLKRTTLQAMVKRLGIDRPRFCRHFGTCRVAVERVSALVSHRPSRDRAYTPCCRRLTGVSPDVLGSDSARAQTPPPKTGARHRRSPAPRSADHWRPRARTRTRERPTRQPVVQRWGRFRPRVCRHVGSCRSVGSPVSSLASHRSRRGGGSRPACRRMTGVVPDRRGSGTALA
jgi:DNA-binding NtrC family response regulator